MTDIKIKRYADKENLKKLMKYSKATFATQSEVNDKFYTKEQVDKKVSDLVNSAPETLDTLNELASALGNDPNFAITIATQIGNKANSSDVYNKSETDTLLSDLAKTSDLSNYYTKSEVDNLLSNISGGTEGSDDVTGGLSFLHAVEHAPGYDGTSQMNIAEDSNTVEDE